MTFPFLTSYDPPGAGEGSLDPLGLYQIAERLAEQLVPAVRERMQRVRFLTAMTVGAYVTEGLEDDPRNRDASPCLVWEWLVIEALVQAMGNEGTLFGVPGTDVTRRALNQHGYLDARSYLKTPRVFGFNGVYKRLAVYLGLVDVHLAPGPHAQALVDAWARSIGLRCFAEAKPKLERWKTAVRRSLEEKPPRTRPGWGGESWKELAEAFAPSECKHQERRCLKDLLLQTGNGHQLGALPIIWDLPPMIEKGELREERLHDELEKKAPQYGQLLDAIRAYEAFSRSITDAFDVLRAEAGGNDAQGFVVAEIAKDQEFQRSVQGLDKRFAAAYQALGEVNISNLSLQALFSEKFSAFGEPMDPDACAETLCVHHEKIQGRKSAAGKRSWFQRIPPDRIYIRQQYRRDRPEIESNRYVSFYRGSPIRRFHSDLP